MADRVEAPVSWLLRALVALVLPVALAAPVVLLLHRQAGALDAAERDLDAALADARAQTGSVARFERVRAQVLARKYVVEALEDGGPEIGALFNVLGALPDGVRIDSIRQAGAEVSIAGTAARGDAAVAAVLESGGLIVLARDAAAPGRFALRADLRGLRRKESAP